MKHPLIVAGIVLFVGIAFYLNSLRHGRKATHHTHTPSETTQRCETCREAAEKKTLAELRSVPYLEAYIVDVINHGSRQRLGFKYGDMPEGMADAEAAPKIAAYVVTLAGLKPTRPEWVKEGRIFYVSNCGGCHGEDGRGVHGTFPDLTRHPLLGIERRIRAAVQKR